MYYECENRRQISCNVAKTFFRHVSLQDIRTYIIQRVKLEEIYQIVLIALYVQLHVVLVYSW